MLLFEQDPHVMCDPLHRHPGLIAAVHAEEATDRSAQDELLEAALKSCLGPAWTLTPAG
jgi:hypothetical protein